MHKKAYGIELNAVLGCQHGGGFHDGEVAQKVAQSGTEGGAGLCYGNLGENARGATPRVLPTRVGWSACETLGLSWCDQKGTALCDQKRTNPQNLALEVALQLAALILSEASAEDRALRGRNLSAAPSTTTISPFPLPHSKMLPRLGPDKSCFFLCRCALFHVVETPAG